MAPKQVVCVECLLVLPNQDPDGMFGEYYHPSFFPTGVLIHCRNVGITFTEHDLKPKIRVLEVQNRRGRAGVKGRRR